MKPGKLAKLLRGFDADELAPKCYTHATNVRRWLTGEALPHRKTLALIAIATDLSLEDLKAAYKADKAARDRAK